MTTTESNKLIAEFMGWKEQTDPTERFLGMWKSPDNCWFKALPNFDSDWSAIMPVVEKIESLGFKFSRYKRETCITDNGFKGLPSDIVENGINTESAYKTVTRFITWHNTQNK